MHYALCTLHYAHMPPCTFAPLTLHLDIAHSTHTHTQQFAHATWGGVVSYVAILLFYRSFLPILAWRHCLECCFGPLVPSTTLGACNYGRSRQRRCTMCTKNLRSSQLCLSEVNCTFDDNIENANAQYVRCKCIPECHTKNTSPF